MSKTSSLSFAAVQPRVGDRIVSVASFVLLAILCIVPRAANLGLFLTTDEANYWQYRSATFLAALRSGNFAATAISDHPGVTTMWLGSAGLLLRDWAFRSGAVHDTSLQMGLTLLHLPLAVVHTLAVLVGYGLLRRLFSVPVASLAAVLWALDPFVLAYSRVLHVDALLGSFATLSILAACVAWHHHGGNGYVVLSAICTALAILSKSPGLSLVPMIAVIAMLAWRDRAILGGHTALRTLAVWAAVCALATVALWPALWADPVGAYVKLRTGVLVEGAQPHDTGNFFLGRADDSPGALFYPVALALRLTPITLFGILALPLAVGRWRTTTMRSRDLAAMIGYVLLFLAAMTVFPKKFNRYIEPIFPLIDILAAIGLLALFGVLVTVVQRRLFVHQTDRQIAFARAARLAVFGVLTIGAALNVAFWHPYEIAGFNQLLGGAQAGARTFQAGWGEGHDQVAAWLNQQPDIKGVTTVAAMGATLQPFMVRGAQVRYPDGDVLPDSSGYVVVYLRQMQRNQLTTPFSDFYPQQPPLHTVIIHGVEYAWIYQVPPAVNVAQQAQFGDVIALRGFDGTAAGVAGQPLDLQLVWEATGTLPNDVALFAHVLDASGERKAQIDIPLPPAPERQRFYRTALQVPLPADLAPGPYRLVLGLYRNGDGGRLPLRSTAALDPSVDGPGALLLCEVTISRS